MKTDWKCSECEKEFKADDPMSSASTADFVLGEQIEDWICDDCYFKKNGYHIGENWGENKD